MVKYSGGEETVSEEMMLETENRSWNSGPRMRDYNPPIFYTMKYPQSQAIKENKETPTLPTSY